MAIGGARPRCVLAVLALEAGRVVSTERLAEALWGDDPPAATANAIQAAVSRLRRALAGAGQGAEAAIVRHGHGYRLDVDRQSVDLHRFRTLVTSARALPPQRHVAAERLFAKALRLWHGAPLADVDSALVHQRLVPALRQEWLAATLDHHDLVLALGEPVRLAHELAAMVQEYPADQRLSGQLMRALAGSGRPADALAEYQRLHRHLDREFGLRPGHDLRRLQAEILGGDREHAAPEPGDRRHGHAPPWPATLPPAPADFTGRARQLSWLADRVRATGGGARPGGSPVTISVLTGPAGAGKTALALRAAHDLAGAFPDGQLYVDLRGTGAIPVRPAQALASLLVAVGVPDHRVPDRTEDRAALLRGRLAGRRVMIVLDDAAEEAQVRPLLPGGPTCAVIITARRTLAGLESVDRLRVDVFTAQEAVDLIRMVAGGRRVDAEIDTAHEIARLCGHLPLAVRVAAARLATRADLSLARLADRLSGERGRLDELVAGDLDVRASLARGYRALPARQREAFRALGLPPAPDVDASRCAVAMDTSMTEAEDLLDALVDANLLDVSPVDHAGAEQGCYRIADLTRMFARELAGEAELASAPRVRRLSCGLVTVRGGGHARQAAARPA